MEEKKTVYVGTGTQKQPELIEVIIYTDEIKDHIRQSKRGRFFIVLNVWKRKTAGEYGETHNLTLQNKKEDE
jgi:capsule polysaccharide export protein KpsC/LpsZ